MKNDDYVTCIWTRLPDIDHPFETHPVQYNIGCIDKVARGVHAIYPDECPHCHKAVVPAPQTGEQS